MLASHSAARRALVRVDRHLSHISASQHRRLNLWTSSVSGLPEGATRVRVGDVTVTTLKGERPDLVPGLYRHPDHDTQECLQQLRWLMQKHSLGQDVYLIGPPGPLRRRLALHYCEVTGREAEYLPITRDTTEADLKQRAEVRDGSLHYVDQAPVTCARYGRVLIVEGIEKAERNVLPTLNNLLENREMALEDGRFLVHHSRYDALLGEHTEAELTKKKLVRVHPNFRVIAIGLPVPRFPGYPLDPPLRSRFQARAVGPLRYREKIVSLGHEFGDRLSNQALRRLLSFRETLRLMESQASRMGSAIPHLPESGIEHAARLLSLFPSSLHDKLLSQPLLERVFPYDLVCDETQSETVLGTMRKFDIPTGVEAWCPTMLSIALTPGNAKIVFATDVGPVTINATTGPATTFGTQPTRKAFVVTDCHRALLGPIIQDHAAGRDVCLVGGKGCGKSAFVNYLAAELGYAGEVYTVHLFKDMSSRDLLMRRTTDTKGNTIWATQTFLHAAVRGGLCVLDGLDRLPPSTLAVLAPLITDRELSLPDGSRLTRMDRYKKLVAELGQEEVDKRRIQPIAESFRVIALALPPSVTAQQKQRNWLVEETMSLFSFHILPDITDEVKVQVMQSLFPSIETKGLSRLLSFVDQLPHQVSASSSHPSSSSSSSSSLVSSSSSSMPVDPASASLSLSLRQIIKLGRRFNQYPSDLPDALRRTVLAPFLPQSIRAAFEEMLSTLAAQLPSRTSTDQSLSLTVDEEAGTLTIGDVQVPLSTPTHPELVPSIVFFDIPRHVEILQDLLKDFLCGEKHILLIGNQGVGKNKLADRLLQLLRLEREYMQLHRDTTVQALTLSPSLVDGVVVYEDSALVKAAEHGRVLMIDEADKAPLEVVAVLKGLVEDGEMTLSDGRRIVRGAQAEEGTIPLHPDFKCIVLANRPGFPFLGNDFFRESGDVFSCHVIDNPDKLSELSLLRSYGPDVEEDTIVKLVDVFADLRLLVEEGTFSYPYSTRELVNIVRHLQLFPNDGMITALGNVLSFDAFEPQLMSHLQTAFGLHGIPLADDLDSPNARPIVSVATSTPLPEGLPLGEWRETGEKGKPKLALTVAKLKARSWLIDIGNSRTVEAWEEGRLHRFTELRSGWKIPMEQGGKALDVVTLADDSVHVLVSAPLSVCSFFKDTLYRRMNITGLEDFLPMAPATAEQMKLRLVALPGMNKLLVVAAPAPFSCLLLLDVPEAQSTATHTAQVAAVTLIPLPSATQESKSFASYISPGFRLPRWYAQGGADPATTPVVVNPHDNSGFVLSYTPNSSVLFALDMASLTTRGEDSALYSRHSLTLPFPIGRVLPLGDRDAEFFLVESMEGARYTFPLSALLSSSPLLSLSSSVPPLTFGRFSQAFPACLPAPIASDSNTGASAWRRKRTRSPGASGTPLAAQTQTGTEGTTEPRAETAAAERETGAETERSDQPPPPGPLVSAVLVGARARAPTLQFGDGSVFSTGSGSGSLTEIPWPAGVTPLAIPAAYLKTSGQLAVATQVSAALLHPEDVATSNEELAECVTLINVHGRSARHIKVQHQAQDASSSQDDLTLEDLNMASRINSRGLLLAKSRARRKDMTPSVVAVRAMALSKDMVVLQRDGYVSLYEADGEALQEGVKAWRRLFGLKKHIPLRMEREGEAKKEVSGPKHGKVDGKEHHGGNTWAGGTGGSDTAGLGGKGGPYRLDAGNDVYQLSDEEKEAVPEHVQKAAREMGQKELEKRLKEIDMGLEENEVYEKYMSKVGKQIVQLRLVLEQAEAKQQEREWLRNQNQGDLDDMKLVDALTGEKSVYRRRGTATPQAGLPQKLPKRLAFVLDVSGSMYRFNGTDQRLERLMETALLLMEALAGFEHKYVYSMVGHSGDGPAIPLVAYGQPPQSRKERLQILQRMNAHAQYCQSGDYTLEATKRAVEEVVKVEADDYFVFVVSDANLSRYAIAPRDLGLALKANAKVNSYCIFIASLQDEINEIMAELPPGHAFFAQETSTLPNLFRQIFTSSSLVK